MRLSTLLANQLVLEMEKREMERSEIEAGLEVERGWDSGKITLDVINAETDLLKEVKRQVAFLDDSLDEWLDHLKTFCKKAENSKYRLRRHLIENASAEQSIDEIKRIAQLRGEEDAYRRICDELSVLTNY